MNVPGRTHSAAVVSSGEAELNEFTFQVDADSHGIRIDRFLVRQLRNYTSFRMQRMVCAGAVRAGGETVALTRRVRRGEWFTLRLIEPPDKLLDPEPLPLKVLFEDEAIIAVDKPAGQIAHPVGRRQQKTLCNALQWHLDRQSRLRGLLRPGIVHRLDRLTSGVIVVAKSFLAHRRMSIQFQRGEVEKEYLALVEGTVAEDAGSIDAPIGQIPGGHTILKTTRADARNPKPAKTAYTVVRRFDDTTLLSARPLTGRIHQIRVHCASIGHPVVGDEFYGPFDEIRAARLTGADQHAAAARHETPHCLHATRIRFRHPITDEPQTIACPPPDTWGLGEPS